MDQINAPIAKLDRPAIKRKWTKLVGPAVT